MGDWLVRQHTVLGVIHRQMRRSFGAVDMRAACRRPSRIWNRVALA